MTKLIKLSKPRCSQCDQLEEYLNNNNVEHETINILDDVNVAIKYGIMSTPVLILLDDNEIELGRKVGFNPSDTTEVERIISQL